MHEKWDKQKAYKKVKINLNILVISTNVNEKDLVHFF